MKQDNYFPVYLFIPLLHSFTEHVTCLLDFMYIQYIPAIYGETISFDIVNEALFELSDARHESFDLLLGDRRSWRKWPPR